MKKLIIILFSLLLTSCFGPKPVTLPSGQEGIRVTCGTHDICFKRLRKACGGRNFDVLDKNQFVYQEMLLTAMIGVCK